ncbi:DNA-processing protein DprA [Nonomuraea sp. KM90]|uniref:DNA-processing protein DprA n=1 Tax=Nonomuraea sp. KM90 TaxID=3457428 RepID=UPI003FCDF151
MITTRRHARLTLMRLTDNPADPLMGQLLDAVGPAAAVDHIRRGSLPPDLMTDHALRPAAGQVLARWRDRLERADPVGDLERGHHAGARFLTPEEPEWPRQLADLGPAQPLGLWVLGTPGLRQACSRSITIVGSRHATTTGEHLAGELAYQLGERGFTTVSGLAFGIDAAAHRGALNGPALTVAVLPCGIDVCFPPEHRDLYAAIRLHGVMVSDNPPGVAASRDRLLARNRIVACLSQATVVVEALVRSGTMNTVRHAEALGRPLGAVPGPVHSPHSRGCHALIHDGRAVLVDGVTWAAELVDSIPAKASSHA